MIERISQKILDLLEADARLLYGGNAEADPWPGVTREENGDTPQEGFVNLYDKAYDVDGAGHRPGVYVGTRAMEATDALDFQTCSSVRVEYRILQVPLIVCVQATTKTLARQRRNQLRHNIKVILLGNILADGYWYELTTDGHGGVPDRVWTTSTGAGDQGVSEAIATVPVQVRYSFNPTAFA